MNLHDVEHAADRARARELNAHLEACERRINEREARYLDASNDVAANGEGAEELLYQIVDEFADLKALTVSAARMSGIPEHHTLPADDAYLGLCFRRLVRRELDAYCTRKSEEVS